MREIIFRGKRLNDGEWVEGNLFIPDKPDTPTQICIGTNVVRICYDVNPLTIGQYTGLTDKNGKKIFEGDIVLWCGIKGTVVWKGHKFYVKSNLIWDFSDDEYIEVIGNIHDNPELLKG